MTTWFDLSTPSQTERLEEAWPGAPVEQQELCSMLLGIAKEQVIAYAPAPDAEVGEIIPGAITVFRRNLAPSPRAEAGLSMVSSTQATVPTGAPDGRSFRRVTSAAARSVDSGFDVLFYGQTAWSGGQTLGSIAVEPSTTYTASLWLRASKTFTFRLQGQPIRGGSGGSLPTGVIQPTIVCAAGVWTQLWTTFTTPATGMPAVRIDVDTAGTGAQTFAVGDTLDVSMIQLEATATLAPYFDGGTNPVSVEGRPFAHAWDGAENASTSVETYRPDVWVPSYPDRLVYAQLQQAINLWNAGNVSSNGEMGPDSFSFTPRPLDKTIRSIIRPSTGVASVF